MLEKLLQIVQDSQENFENDLVDILPKAVYVGIESTHDTTERVLSVTNTQNESVRIVMTILQFLYPRLHLLVSSESDQYSEIVTDEDHDSWSEGMASIRLIESKNLSRLIAGKGSLEKIERILVNDKHLL